MRKFSTAAEIRDAMRCKQTCYKITIRETREKKKLHTNENENKFELNSERLNRKSSKQFSSFSIQA